MGSAKSGRVVGNGSYPETGFWEARQIGTGKSDCRQRSFVTARAFVRSNPEGWHIPQATPEHLSQFKDLGRIHSGDKPVTMRRFAPSLLC
jgi:hypothetical protein